VEGKSAIDPESMNPPGSISMFDGAQVFVDIDTQRDFLEPEGALYVPGSDLIVPNLGRLTNYALDHGIPVLATACAHAPDDLELRHFPPHCLVGTRGQERIAATYRADSLVLGRKQALDGDLPPHLTLEKRELDLFTHPHAEAILARYRAKHPVFVVYGVATDYCVKAAVEGLVERNCRVALVVDAIRAIDADVEADLLTSFARRGVLLTLTEVVCDPDRRVHIDA
jgi:nicotinamidase/pyrazinamidase